jgi:hypothetical protein
MTTTSDEQSTPEERRIYKLTCAATEICKTEGVYVDELRKIVEVRSTYRTHVIPLQYLPTYFERVATERNEPVYKGDVIDRMVGQLKQILPTHQTIYKDLSDAMTHW